MNKDIYKLYCEKVYISCCILLLLTLLYYYNNNKIYIIIGALYVIFTVLDFYNTKKNILKLHNTYGKAELNQLKYINFKL